jgi:hypothetical protein
MIVLEGLAYGFLMWLVLVVTSVIIAVTKNISKSDCEKIGELNLMISVIIAVAYMSVKFLFFMEV